MISYLIVIDYVIFALFSISGYVTADLLKLLVYSVPSLLLAYIFEKYILNFINPEKLKRIMLVITLFAGTLAIWNFLPW